MGLVVSGIRKKNEELRKSKKISCMHDCYSDVRAWGWDWIRELKTCMRQASKAEAPSFTSPYPSMNGLNSTTDSAYVLHGHDNQMLTMDQKQLVFR